MQNKRQPFWETESLHMWIHCVDWWWNNDFSQLTIFNYCSIISQIKNQLSLMSLNFFNKKYFYINQQDIFFMPVIYLNIQMFRYFFHTHSKTSVQWNHTAFCNELITQHGKNMIQQCFFFCAYFVKKKFYHLVFWIHFYF